MKLSVLVNQNVSFVDFLKGALSKINQGSAKTSVQLESHVQEMIDFLEILTPLISDTVKEECANTLKSIQDGLSKSLENLFDQYMTDIHLLIC